MRRFIRGFGRGVWNFGLIGCLCLAAPVPAKEKGQQAAHAAFPLLKQRGDEIIAVLNGQRDLEVTFAPSFRKAVSDAQLRALAASLHAQLGKATGVKSLRAVNDREANMVLSFEKGTAKAWMVLAPDAPAQVAGLRITGIEPASVSALNSLEDVAQAFGRLPGRAGFIVQDISGASPEAAQDKDTPLGIGSAFKLVILAELVREIEAGERTWTDMVTLDGTELPAGGFRAMPKGTQVSLRTLAEEMVRVSDNSATDVLLARLGREKVEAMQPLIGFAHGARNVPFLSTMELFKLKGVEGGALGQRYLEADISGKRALLAGEVARAPGSAVGALFADGRPVMIDRLEWFASAEDLVRAMRWFREHSRSAAGQEALRILALNPGPAADIRSQVRYVGYKGGSEPGVLNMTTLIEDTKGRWLVVAATVNDPEKGVDLMLFQALFARALALAIQD